MTAGSTTLTIDITDLAPDVVGRLHAEIQRILQPGPAPMAPATVGQPVVSGWSDQSVEKALDLLAKGGHTAQLKAIRFALEHGLGHVTRSKVYELAGWDPQLRSLKGFTRPINRVTEDMKADGQLPAHALALLAPSYDPAVSGYQRAPGFDVPEDLIWQAG